MSGSMLWKIQLMWYNQTSHESLMRTIHIASDIHVTCLILVRIFDEIRLCNIRTHRNMIWNLNYDCTEYSVRFYPTRMAELTRMFLLLRFSFLLLSPHSLLFSSPPNLFFLLRVLSLSGSHCFCSPFSSFNDEPMRVYTDEESRVGTTERTWYSLLQEHDSWQSLASSTKTVLQRIKEAGINTDR